MAKVHGRLALLYIGGNQEVESKIENYLLEMESRNSIKMIYLAKVIEEKHKNLMIFYAPFYPICYAEKPNPY